MEHTEKLHEIIILQGDALKQGGDADKVAAEIIEDLEALRKAASSRRDAVAAARDERDEKKDEITQNKEARKTPEDALETARTAGEKIDQTIRNLQEAFAEHRDTATPEEFETFNAEVAEQRTLRSENQQEQANLKAQITALDEVRASLENELAGKKTALQDSKTAHSNMIWKLLDAANALASGLDQAIQMQVSLIQPNEKGADHYLVQSDTGLDVKREDLIPELRKTSGLIASTPEGRSAHLKFNKVELEGRVQQLLDHMTSRRIAEEGDTDVYVQRLHLAYRRVEGEANRQRKLLKGDASNGNRNTSEVPQATLETFHEVQARLARLNSIAQHLHKEILTQTQTPSYLDQTTRKPSEQDIREAIEKTATFASNSYEFAQRVAVFLNRGHEKLGHVINQFCSRPVVDGATNQSVSVSRDAESSYVTRMLPLLCAITITLMVKIILANTTSLVAHEHATAILTNTFLATWAISIFLGQRSRKRRMSHLQRETGTAFDTIANGDHAGAKTWDLTWWRWFFNLSPALVTRGKTVRFEPAALNEIALEDTDRKVQPPNINAFDSRKSLRREIFSLGVFNACLLVIPIALFLVLYPRGDGFKTYVSVLENGEACNLMSGRLVAADDTTLYLQTLDEEDAKGELGAWRYNVTKNIFPEVLARPIARDRIVDVLPHGGKLPSRRCADGVRVASADFMAPDKVFPAAFRDQIVKAQGALRRIVVDGDVSSRRQHEFSTLLQGIREELGDKVTEEQAVRLIMSGMLPSAAPVIKPGDGGDIFQNFTTTLGGVDKVVEAIGSLKGQADPGIDQDLRAAALRLDGLEEFARFIALAVQSNAQLGKTIAENTKALREANGHKGEAAPTLISVVAGGGNATAATVPPAPAVVVSPTVNMAEFQQPTTMATHITLSGPQVVQHSIQNTLFMPFFPDPVEGEKLQKPLDAYRYGLSNLGFKPPKDTTPGQEGRDYFTAVSDAIRKCLATDADRMISLDIQGHASSSWDAPVPAGYSKEEFNHRLAEGRRMGVLMRLKSKVPQAGIQDKIMVASSATDTPLPLSSFELVDENSPDPLLEDAFDKRRFGKPDNLRNSQKGWMSAIPLQGANAKNALEEIFARTVIIEITGFEGTSCTFKQQP